ncbi:hypothetical protein FOA43_000651 [Brettanomyces nanus]|uniref:Uncharacterized protein n=1 Tax=Eeniella nana TaxID=13502 RepID=A0A875RW36_EENNA|nr:uncharacterized protein FOA43_000651 [Brettanomyces nanus]QPG73341.1 hypothetical protein FOA43_000651 [Brettanomyces nanus]
MSDIQRPIEMNDFVAAIKDIGDDQLYQVMKRLTNSIRKLGQSNLLMTDLMNRDIEKANQDDNDTDGSYEIPTDDDAKLYRESIQGNERVIDNQQLRIVAIDLELERRGSKNVRGIKNLAVKQLEKPSISTDNDVVDITAPNSVIL